MNQADVELSPLAAAFVMSLAVACVAALLLWIRRWWTNGYVLAYEPRQRPPWGPMAGVLAVLMTLVGVANAVAMRTADPAVAEFEPGEFAQNQLMMSLMQIVFATAIVVVLLVLFGARIRDLGWPTSAQQFTSDVRLGVWISLASMVPLYVLQVAAMLLLDIPPGHPLLDQMASTPDVRVFASVMFAAVVSAPLFEEVVFRLLLQGGLEVWEDEQIGWPLSCARRLRRDSTLPEPLDMPTEHGHGLAPGAEVLDDTTPDEQRQPVAPAGLGAMPGLGHGWGPILASSFLFALAHVGNGPSPIALFVFAMFLGYAYQRTHRILPSIVAHAVLNFVSVLVMILAMSAS